MASVRTPLSYAAAVSGSNGQFIHGSNSRRCGFSGGKGTSENPDTFAISPSTSRRTRRRCSLHRTLLTDQQHHDRMTRLRTQYFPKRINKLDAHLTFFHALPGSKLESAVIPVLQDVAQHTAPFRLLATKPFRLKHGIALSVAKTQGAQQAQGVHRALLEPWLKEGFLSEQDRGRCNVHYTIMNKVDDELQIAKALEEVRDSFKPDAGTAEGLGLWRYDRGWWRWERRSDFAG
ncbi:hypothetical protein LTR02_016383 [Friedmanniomyces endolithicus]|nr:hypothetical protein LTR02_016383 [Friedmanniomyces endolithicus]